MTTKSLLTNNLRGTLVTQTVTGPSTIIKSTGLPVETLYVFLAQVDPWPDENNPPVPTQDWKYLKSIYKKMFVLKKVLASEISPILARIDWTANTVYDYYQDSIDMTAIDSNGILVHKFYAKNKYDQVFKCLWNKNGGLSTSEPFFQPGTYKTNNIYAGSDGYKWKFMYTISPGLKRAFMDTNWMPVSVPTETIYPFESPEGTGGIEVINVINGGSGFDQVNSAINITIIGDGTGAAAFATSANGVITDIIVTNPGSNYSSANTTATSANGSNATFSSPSSPIGGHGLDAFSELGCRNVMFSVEFNTSEGGVIPTDIKYRQIGLLSNPVSLSSIASFGSDDVAANGAIYQSTTNLLTASGFGSFVSGEIVYQGPSANAATFIGTVLSFDNGTNQIKVINTLGTVILNASIFGQSSSTARTLLQATDPDIIVSTGSINYIGNITGVQRSIDGIEQFKFVLNY